MADSLGPDDRAKALAQALAAVGQIGDDDACVRSLGVVAQRFQPGDQVLVQEALQVAQRIGDGAKRAIALSAVVDNLSPSERQKVMREALAAACRTDDESERASGLATLADHLSVEEWEFAASLLSAARQMGTAYLRARILASVAARFPSRRQALLHEAVKVADDEAERDVGAGFAMCEVARQLAPDDRELLEQVLLSTRQLERPDGGARRNILQELVPRIAADDATLLRLALEVARQDLDRWGPPEALCIVGRRLPQEEREPLIAELLAIAHAEKGLGKAMVLGNMVTLLTPDNQEATLIETLALIRETKDDRNREGHRLIRNIVRDLGPQSPRLFELIRSEAVEVSDPIERADVLFDILAKSNIHDAVRLADSLLPVLKYSWRGVPSNLSSQWEQFCRLRGTSPTDELGAWLGSLNGVSRSGLIDHLRTLVGPLERVGGEKVISEMVAAIVESGGWWA